MVQRVIEPTLATGTIDIFAMDENCSPPYLKPYADKFQIHSYRLMIWYAYQGWISTRL